MSIAIAKRCGDNDRQRLLEEAWLITRRLRNAWERAWAMCEIVIEFPPGQRRTELLEQALATCPERIEEEVGRALEQIPEDEIPAKIASLGMGEIGGSLLKEYSTLSGFSWRIAYLMLIPTCSDSPAIQRELWDSVLRLPKRIAWGRLRSALHLIANLPASSRERHASMRRCLSAAMRRSKPKERELLLGLILESPTWPDSAFTAEMLRCIDFLPASDRKKWVVRLLDRAVPITGEAAGQLLQHSRPTADAALQGRLLPFLDAEIGKKVYEALKASSLRIADQRERLGFLLILVRRLPEAAQVNWHSVLLDMIQRNFAADAPNWDFVIQFASMPSVRKSAVVADRVWDLIQDHLKETATIT